VIGAQKSATTWLAWNLGQHPDVFTAPNEVMFFNNSRRFNDLGTAWYREQFRGWSGQTHVGETTAGYMMLGHRPEVVSKRIRQTVPEIRLIAILRNPVDRAQSAMVHHIRRRRLPLRSRLVDLVHDHPELCERHNLIAGGLYAESLEPFRRRFDNQLLVLIHDDAIADPEGVYATALGHIGTDDTFVPADLRDLRHTNQPASSDAERRSPLDAVVSQVGRLKRRALRQPRKAGEFEVAPLTDADRRDLYELFAADVSRLEEMLGRDLSIWRPPG
jgi:hypothetical protein